MKYKLNNLFKDKHGVIYLITREPIYTVRKDKKITYTDENFILTRIPDIVEYESKYDGSKIRHTFPEVKMTEELIEINVRRKTWEVI